MSDNIGTVKRPFFILEMCHCGTKEVDMKYKEKNIDFDELRTYILESSLTSSVYIGGDSKTFKRDGVRQCAYCISVIVHRDSKHGGVGFHQILIEPDYGDIASPRARLMNEVYKVVEVATKIVDCVGERKFEIHLDVSEDPQYKSYSALKEAKGVIRGIFGFDATTKPAAWAASCVSDKYAVGTAKREKNSVKAKGTVSARKASKKRK